MSADDAVATVEAVFGVEEMHRAALASGDAGAFAEELGHDSARVRPDAAFWHRDLGEFVLPYATVWSAPDPDATLLEFLESTYEAAANLGGWNRLALECAPGVPLVPRPVHTADDS